MNKGVLALFLLALLFVGHSSAAGVQLKKAKDVGADLCPLCVQFTGETISELLNIILNVGVVGGCDELCSLLHNKVEAEVCNILCDIVGVEAFVHLIEKADLDPIYFCELITVCPVHDCEGQCVKITDAVVRPPQGPTGTTFQIDLAFQVFNQTSTGTIEFTVLPPDGMPFGDAELVPKGFQPGTYTAAVQLETNPTEQEPFSPGTYGVDIALCEGECGSKHPHSYVYDTKKLSFQITE